MRQVASPDGSGGSAPPARERVEFLLEEEDPGRRRDGSHRLARRLERRGLRRQRAHAGVLQDVARFARAEFRIDGHHHRTETREREKQHHVACAVGSHDADAIAAADPPCGKSACRGGDLLRTLRVGKRLAGKAQERPLGHRRGAAREQSMQGSMVRRVGADDRQRAKHGRGNLAR
jgi:hypothetical protein